MIEQDKKLPHFELTGSILNCCFEVMKELGPGFLENVYKCFTTSNWFASEFSSRKIGMEKIAKQSRMYC